MQATCVPTPYNVHTKQFAAVQTWCIIVFCIHFRLLYNNFNIVASSIILLLNDYHLFDMQLCHIHRLHFSCWCKGCTKNIPTKSALTFFYFANLTIIFEDYCYLGNIASIVEEKDTSNIIITSDCNAAVKTDLVCLYQIMTNIILLHEYITLFVHIVSNQ